MVQVPLACVLPLSRNTYKIGVMPVDKNKLTPTQKADASRLRAAFKAWQADQKARGFAAPQHMLTGYMGINQSAISQYLNAYIPLNADILLKFCELMGTDPESISPTIMAQVREHAKLIELSKKNRR